MSSWQAQQFEFMADRVGWIVLIRWWKRYHFYSTEDWTDPLDFDHEGEIWLFRS